MDYSFEKTLIPEDVRVVCGLDEAGRGPLAGPVFAGAVILPEGYVPEGLNDSKKLSEKKREKLFTLITENAVAWSFGTASPEEIDEINILNASMLAMKRAVESLSVKPDFLLIDGNIARGFDIKAVPVIKGDAKSPHIAAASIIAKVTRDRLMVQYEDVMPGYGFASNKGYGSAAHIQAIKEIGVTPIHRQSFIKNFI